MHRRADKASLRVAVAEHERVVRHELRLLLMY